jgi:hypothetical protein
MIPSVCKPLKKMLSTDSENRTIGNAQVEDKYVTMNEYERYTITPGIATGRL